jgi:Protein of unknown function (DUF2568)/EamA-like transporter family
VLALGVLSTGVAYVLNYRLIQEEGPTAASMANYLTPVVAVLLGIAFVDERLTWNLVIGTAVILAGLWMAEHHPDEPRPARTRPCCRRMTLEGERRAAGGERAARCRPDGSVPVRAGAVGRARLLGFSIGNGVTAWLLGIGAPLLAAIVWGALVAPKARWPLPLQVRLVIELLLFASAAGALAVAGQPVLAVVLAGAALATSLLNAVQEHRPRADATRQ